MSVSSKMTTIADKIRSITGVGAKLGLDAMTNELNAAKSHITSAFTAVETKGGTVPDAKVSGNLADAIDSIPEGVELNFEVVGGTSAPTDPRENTIWINTGTPITKWEIATDNPYVTKQNIYSTAFMEADHYLNEVGEWCPDSDYDILWNQQLPLNTVSIMIPTSGSDITSAYHMFNHDNGTSLGYVLRNTASFTYPVPNGADTISVSFRKKDFKTIIANVNTAVSGDVWITVDAAANIGEFNALKANGINVYPLAAEQYIDGKWTKMPTKIRRNGAWVDCVTKLYESGKTELAITTKPLKATATSVNTAIEPRIGINNTNFWAMVQKSDSGGTAGLAYFDPKIDLTDVSTLYVNGTFSSGNNGAFPYIGVWSKFGEHSGEYRSAMKAGCTTSDAEYTGTVAVDVSAVTGEHYIGFYMSTTTNACSVSVKQIYYD